MTQAPRRKGAPATRAPCGPATPAPPSAPSSWCAPMRALWHLHPAPAELRPPLPQLASPLQYPPLRPSLR
eukprot:scaffold47568_cov22-Tisochrysis_lutea.AAC.1